MKGPLDIHQYLLANDVPHEIVRLPHSTTNALHLAEVLGLPTQRCVASHPFHVLTPTADALVVLLRTADAAGDETAMCDLLAETLAATVGPHAVIAPACPNMVSARTDYLASHLAPLLLPPDVIVAAAPEIYDLASSIVYTATGDAGTALAIPAADLLTLTGARPTTVDAPATRAVTDLVLEPTVALRPKLVTAGAGFIGLATDGTELAANSIRAGIG